LRQTTVVKLSKWCAVLLPSNNEHLFPNSFRGFDLRVYSVFILFSYIERRLATGRSSVQVIQSDIYKQHSEIRKSVSLGCIVLITRPNWMVELKALCEAVGFRDFWYL